MLGAGFLDHSVYLACLQARSPLLLRPCTLGITTIIYVFENSSMF